MQRTFAKSMVVQFKAEKMKLEMKKNLFAKFGLTSGGLGGLFKQATQTSKPSKTAPESPAAKKIPQISVDGSLGSSNPAGKLGGLLANLNVSPEKAALNKADMLKGTLKNLGLGVTKE